MEDVAAGTTPPRPPMGLSFACPVEYHIPVEFNDIYAIVRSTLSLAHREAFEELVQLIESLYTQEFMALRRSLKRNFRPFSAGAKGQTLQTRVGKALPHKSDLDMREISLVDDFIQLMGRARFHILDHHDYRLAKGHRFLFQLPVVPNWDYFDKRLLQSYWSSTTTRRRLRLLLPDEVADSCLVFHRGVRVMTDSGLYINEKIELLLQYTVVWLVMLVWAFLKRLLGRLAAACRKVLRLAPIQAPKTDAEAEAPLGEGQEGRKRSGNVIVVERRSLKLMMPTLWKLILGFPRTFTLQEPAFKEVVMLYRKKVTHKKGAKVKRTAADKRRSSVKSERLAGILERRNVFIKAFHDIPMADLDAVFPEKKIWLKTLPLINMVVTVVTAAIALVSLAYGEGEFDLNVTLSTLSLVIARCYQVYSGAQVERSNMMQEMTKVLYDKTDDAQEGVMTMLLDNMADQQLKETVIAYLTLYLDNAEMSAEKLDQKAETFLEEYFDIKVDFKVDATLERLLAWNLVTVKETPKSRMYSAVPLEQAREVLQKRWAGIYLNLGRTACDKKDEDGFEVTDLFSDPDTVLPPLPKRVPVKVHRDFADARGNLDTAQLSFLGYCLSWVLPPDLLNWRAPAMGEVVTWFEDSCLGFGVFLGLISPRRLRQPTPEEEESVGDNDGKDKASMQRAPASVARSGLTSVAPSELGSEAPAKKRGLLRRIFKSKDKAPPYGPAGPIPSKPVFRLVGRRAAGSSPGPAPPSPPSSSTGTHATAAPANSASRPSVGFALDPSGPPTVGIALAPAKVPSVSVSLSPANTPRGR